jgi:hypothetical protein
MPEPRSESSALQSKRGPPSGFMPQSVLIGTVSLPQNVLGRGLYKPNSQAQANGSNKTNEEYVTFQWPAYGVLEPTR